MPFFRWYDFATPSWDVFLLLFLAIGSLLYGLTLGRNRIVVIMISIYMGLAVVTNAPYLADLTAFSPGNDVAMRVGVFLGIFILLFFFLSRNALLSSMDNGHGGGFLKTMLFSVLHVGLLVSVGLSFLPDSLLGRFSSQTRNLFVSDPARFAWLVAPIAAMMIFGSRKG